MERRDPTTGSREDRTPAEWGNIDQAADPTSFARFLASRGASEAEIARRRLRFALLAVVEGDRVLDVGCGVGDDVRALAQIVGKTGRIVGTDNSETIIAEARKRSEGSDLPVEFYVGDAHRLEFPDSTFDSCQSCRTFQYLEEPRRALMEMIRVVKPTGRIVIWNVDWETMLVDAPDRAVTRRVLNYWGDSMRDGWMGRKLFGLFHKVGLKGIAIEPVVDIGTDHTVMEGLLGLEGLRRLARNAQEAGVVSPAEAASWVSSLEEAGRSGRFFAAMTAFAVMGRKP